jgi:alpha-ketoglutarate-dependent taurine dioxygenase
MTVVDPELVRPQVLLEGWCAIPSVPAMTATGILATLSPLLSSGVTHVYHHDLKPYDKHSAPRGSMSATTGTDAQPMHTDGAYCHLPPRFIALQCLEPGEAHCPTDVWSLDLARLRGDSSIALTRPVWVSRGGGRTPFYCSVLEVQGGTARVRFDRLCMRPLHGANHAVDEVQEVLERCSQQVEMRWARGSLLIIDNWRCLHARGEGAAQAPSRRMRRWTIGASDGLVA